MKRIIEWALPVNLAGEIPAVNQGRLLGLKDLRELINIVRKPLQDQMEKDNCLTGPDEMVVFCEMVAGVPVLTGLVNPRVKKEVSDEYEEV